MKTDQVVFAVSPRPLGPIDILLGVSAAAWDYMKDGRTHTFDLMKLGLPIRIFLYGGPDQKTVRAHIDQHNRSLGLTEVQDRSDDDFSITGPPDKNIEKLQSEIEKLETEIDGLRNTVAEREAELRRLQDGRS